jgi:hypothetical protein
MELSRVDGKPRFWATTYSRRELSNPTVLQRLYDLWTTYVRRPKPNPAAYSFFVEPVEHCVLGSLANQSMEVIGTQYLIAVEAAGSTVDFGHTNTLSGTQWVTAFEQAITNQPVLCFEYPEQGGFKDELVLIREKPDLVKIVPRTKLARYQAAGLIPAQSGPAARPTEKAP